jgi:hypothetical protein
MRSRRAAALALSTTIFLAGAASAQAALVDLTPGVAVNDDPFSGIESDGGLSQLFDSSTSTAGGSLVAGARREPWTAFSQLSAGDDQIFVRAFFGSRWVTQGHGTLGGLSSDDPLAPSSLNFSDDSDAEQPAIDFAGPGRTVPWAVWSEQNRRGPSNPAPAQAQIFASRFHPPSTEPDSDRWEFAGQNRTTGDEPGLPSLNLHVDRDARDPALAGGSPSDQAAPGPWVAWRETGAHAPGTGVDQIFVARPSAPGPNGCEPSVRLGDQTGGKSFGDTCFGQVGTERLGTDPSLNVDRTRAAGDPDMAFGGPDDSVPWVVWREHGPTQTTGAGQLHDNAMVFAAKGVPPAAGSQGTTDGGLTWVVVGQDAQGALDAGPTGGSCGADALSEELCSINENLLADAGAPRVTTGTMTPGAATVPWIVWAETNGSLTGIFATRLVGTGADAHFELANRGHPLGFGALPDITFAGHTPYVSWIGTDHAVHTGHFTDPASFVADHTSASQTFQRAALSSTCTADPFSADGSACPGGALGTPFAGFDDASGAGIALRGATYPAGAPQTGDATAVSDSAATIAGVVTPQGARATAFFEYGPTTAYGSRTAAVDVAGDGPPIVVSERLTGLPPGTTMHYRLVTANDLVRGAGEDATFVTGAVPAPDPPPPTAPPAPDPPPASMPPAPDPPPTAAAPHVRLASRVHVGKHRVRLAIGVDTAADVTLRGTLTGRARGRRRALALGIAAAHYDHAGRRTLTIELDATARHALQRWHAVRISLIADAVSAGGTASVRAEAGRGGVL